MMVMCFVFGVLFGYLICCHMAMGSVFEKQHGMLNKLALTLMYALMLPYFTKEHPSDEV